MDTDTALIEAVFAFAKHAGTGDLTEEAAHMVSRVFDLTVRAGIASSPEAWKEKEYGRTYVLSMMGRIGEEAARLAGSGKDISGEIYGRAANIVIAEQRKRFGMPVPDTIERPRSKFCFCFVDSELFDPTESRR
jgi:hypothetical protein